MSPVRGDPGGAHYQTNTIRTLLNHDILEIIRKSMESFNNGVRIRKISGAKINFCHTNTTVIGQARGDLVSKTSGKFENICVIPFLNCSSGCSVSVRCCIGGNSTEGEFVGDGIGTIDTEKCNA